MEQFKRIGMDTSKQIFQLHGVDDQEAVTLRKRLRRDQVLAFFGRIAPTVVGLEACGGSHYWARELVKLGHEVKLLPPQYVRPYRKRGKHDAADAEAICEAMSRPTMRYVPVKTEAQQAALMVVSVRNQLVGMRTKLANIIRGHAAEFGLTSPRGLEQLEPLLARVADDKALPAMVRRAFAVLAYEYAALQKQIDEIDRDLRAWQRQDEETRRLVKIPSVGPIGASLLSLKTDAKAFKSGRDYAAWIGLTPKNHSTANRTRLGAITRAGDSMLRAVLVTGAMAVIKQVKAGRGSHPRWLVDIVARKQPKEAAVALANRTARIAWKLMVSGEAYRPEAPMAV